MKLADFYATIGPYLEGKRPFTETETALFGAPTADSKRLAIYERFCREHRTTATGGVHLHLRRLITAQRGEGFWRQLVDDYFTAHPMQHVEINENGAQLAAYLASRTELPVLWSALADFEWWEWQSMISPDTEEPEAGPLRIASTVELRPYAYDFVGWLNDDPRDELPPSAQVLVLFWRTRSGEGRRANTTPAELTVLKQLSEGHPVTDSETLEDLHAAGIIVGTP